MNNQLLLKILLSFYFLVNLLVRWEIIFSINDWITWVVGVFSGLMFLCIVCFPRYLQYTLCLFAFTFPLFGAPAALYTRVYIFEFLLCIQSIALIIVSIKSNLFLVKNRLLDKILLLYLIYSSVSILLFPVQDYSFLMHPRLFIDGLRNILYSNSWTSLYSLAGINRLSIFIFSAMLIASQINAYKIFKNIFVSMLISGVITSFLGVLHLYGLLHLSFITNSLSGRLQSLFVHPNVYAVFTTITIPFIFYVFFHKKISWPRIVLLIAVIVISAVGLLFSLCRASWIVYPLTLIVGGLCMYWQKSLHFKLRVDRRVSLSVFLIFSLTLLIGVLFIYSLGNKENSNSVKLTKSVRSTRVDNTTLKKRFKSILHPDVRTKIAQETLFVIKEAPVFGLGFESFGWHTSILAQIPQSGFSQNRKQKRLRGSPHNLYLSQLVNGGIVGLVLWLTLIGVTCNLLISDFLVNQSVGSLSVFLCIFAYHIYGMAESMIFTPLIWFIVFLYIGYATTIDERILSINRIQVLKKWFVICVISVLVGGVAYATNFQSRRLAKKYNLSQYYAPDNLDQRYFSCFYTPAKKKGIGMVRWMGERGAIKIMHKGMMEFSIFYEYPKVLKEPVIVTIDVEGKVIDELVFFKNMIKKRQYCFSETDVGRQINLTVSRTWNPQKFGVRWGRIQGVAVRGPYYFDEIPEDGIGFLSSLRVLADPMPTWSKTEQKYRWIGKRATIRIDGRMEKYGFEAYLRSKHPDVIEKPVEVQMFADGDLIQTIMLSSSDWTLLSIASNRLAGRRWLTFQVSRTWNPRLMGLANDNRNLGIQVAVP